MAKTNLVSVNAKATTSNTSIASVATTNVIFSSVESDTTSMYSTITGKATIDKAGKYEVFSSVYCSNIGSNGVSTEIRLLANQSGSVSKQSTVGRHIVQTNSATGTGLNGGTSFNCAVGDQLWFSIFNGCGGTITLNNSATDNFFIIKRIGD